MPINVDPVRVRERVGAMTDALRRLRALGAIPEVYPRLKQAENESRRDFAMHRRDMRRRDMRRRATAGTSRCFQLPSLSFCPIFATRKAPSIGRVDNRRVYELIHMSPSDVEAYIRAVLDGMSAADHRH